MKKFLWLIVSIMLAVSMVSAQSYKELVAKGKEYEKNKEWIYALGCYNDAIQLQDKDGEAQDLYMKLFTTIVSGKPGYGDFDMFTLHDEWEALVKNAEKYFTENFPYTISSGDIERRFVNYENRTADYAVPISVENSKFYSSVRTCLYACYKYADKESNLKNILWISQQTPYGTDNYNGSWTSYPKQSVCSSKKDELDKANNSQLQKEAQAIYKKTGIAVSYFSYNVNYRIHNYYADYEWEYKTLFEFPAFDAYSPPYGYGDNYTSYTSHSKDKCSCYDIKLGIYDENDKLLIEGTKQLLRFDSGNYYKFDNVTQDKMNILENKKCKVKLMGVWLNYGAFGSVRSHSSNTELKLHNIQMDTSKVQYFDIQEQKRLEEERRIAEEKAAEERKIKEEKEAEERRIAEQKAAEERRRIEEEQRIAAEKQRVKQLEAELDYEIYQAGKFLGIENNSLMIFLYSSVKNTFNGTTLVFEGAFTTRDLEIIAIMCKDVDIYLSDFSNVFDWRNSIKEMDNKEVFERRYIGNILICSGNIKTLDLSKTSIEIIPKGVFARTNIESIILPESLTKVEDYAFYDCSNLKTVKFNGTEKQWKKVKIKDSTLKKVSKNITFLKD